MPKKRKPFRFRLPWFLEARAGTRPKDESKSRKQADKTIDIEEPQERAPAQAPPTQQAQEEHSPPSPSPLLQPEKTFSLTIASPTQSQSKPESLSSMSSFPTSKTQSDSQPRSPAHSALERTSEESRPTTIEGTGLVLSPSQQEKGKMAVPEREPQADKSPLETIPRSQELIQPEPSPHVAEPEPQPKDSPLKSISKSQELTQPESSPHVSEREPQPEMSPLKTVSESQELTQPQTSPHVSETIPHPKESPLKTIPESQDLTQPETSSHVSEPLPKTSPHVPEPELQPRDSPLKSISKSQELTQPVSSPHVSEPMPHVKESPLKVIPTSQDTQPETSSHVSEPVPQSKSPLKTSPKSQELIQLETSSHVSEPVPQLKESPLKTISKPQELIQSETSSKPKRMSSEPTGMLGGEEGPPSPRTLPTDKKFELDSNRENTKSVLETESKLHQNGETEKVVHELTQEGKAEDPMTGRTKAELHIEASTSGTQTKDTFSRVVRAEKKKQDIRENTERRAILAASNATEKDIKVSSSIDSTTKSVSSTSHQKDVLSRGEKTPLKKGVKEDISQFVQKLASGQLMDPTEDKPVNAITLAGENRGATMQISSESTKKESSVQIHQTYRTNQEDSPEVTTESDGEEGSNNLVEKDEVKKAYVNSNIQSVNNSLMYHGSVTEKDPGVQLILPQKAAEFVESDDEDSKG